MASAVPASAVDEIYDSIAEPGRWPSALDSIRRLADGCVAALGVVDTAAGTARLSVACGEERLLGTLIAEYGANLPFYGAIPMMEIDTPYTVDSLYELQGPGARETWLGSKAAQEWVIPNDLDDFFWVPLMKRPSRAGTLVVVTDKARPQITAEDLRLMAEIAPHVRRAVTIGDLFETERRSAAAFRQIVESLANPVLVVGSGMEVIFANDAAHDLLAEGVAVAMAAGQLAVSYAPARAAIANAVATGARNECELGPAGINVPLARVPAPAVAHVMPLARRDPSARFADRAAAAIFISHAGMAPMPALEAIAALFALTAAEARVAGQVAQGRNRNDIALAAGVSQTTVQSQLGAIFDKTGAADQRALELLIRDLSPPIRA
jgi:DNA-binding CsgD family transcriptional regulator/PAS domain-containing protein